MPHNRSVDSDTLRQGAAHFHVERPLSFAVTGCSWPKAAHHFLPTCIYAWGMLRHYPINSRGRDIAVGDIHGCFSNLKRVLEAINFDEQCDRLFSVDDLVDRGPESQNVLEWLQQPWFHAVCSNHDFMTWRRALGDPYEDVDHKAHGGDWLDACTPEHARKIGECLSQLLLAMEVETPDGLVGMVHADYPYDDWTPMQARTLDAQDVECCLWSEARYKTRYASTVRGLREP